MPVKYKIVLVLAAVSIFGACDNTGEKIVSSGPDAVNSSGGPMARQTLITTETGVIPIGKANPIDQALALLNLQISDLVRPQYQEAGYYMIGRLPVIDAVATSPFQLHGWAERLSTRVQKSALDGLAPAVSEMQRALNPTAIGNVAVQFDFKKQWDTSTAYRYLCQRNDAVPDEQVLQALSAAGFSEPFDRQLARLMAIMADAADRVRIAFQHLDEEEIRYLSSRPERYFFPGDNQFNFLTAATHTQQKILKITHKIDFTSLYMASRVLSYGVDNFANYIRKLENVDNAAHFFRNGQKRSGLVLEIPTPIGPVVLLGQDGGKYSGRGALVIDMGGNDHYRGRLGVGQLMPGRIAVAIDIAGDDKYQGAKNGLSFGVGCLGVGILADLSGNDTYQSGDLAQGCGIYGIGLLFDLQGNDIYRMGLMGQGFGVFGAGLLLDLDGNDRYNINGMGQGTGSTLGIGVLCDVRGIDKYLANKDQKRGRLAADEWSHVQGAALSIRPPDWNRRFSIYGGIGLLNDGQGDDFYYASDGNCMGSSYFMSVGVLSDHGGNDTYIPRNGYGLGYAVHLSNGILLDRDGDDLYIGSQYSGGAGSDRSVGMLVDYAGNDIYGPSEAYVRATLTKTHGDRLNALSEEGVTRLTHAKMASASFGSSLKPKALGILIDYLGSDQYYARPWPKLESCGGVVPPAAPDGWSHSLLMDLDGDDYYSLPGRKNNHYFKYLGHGLAFDTRFKDSRRIGHEYASAPQRHGGREMALRSMKDAEPYNPELLKLFDEDLFVRWAAVGRLAFSGPEILPALVRFLSIGDASDINRDGLEVLTWLLVEDRLDLHSTESLVELLTAKDPFVRVFAARALGDWRVKRAVSDLSRVAQNDLPEVRMIALAALGRIGTLQVIDPLVSAAEKDDSDRCRQAAVIALARLAGQLDSDQYADERLRILDVLLRAMASSDEIVRTFAANGLRHYSDRSPAIEALQQHVKDRSVYVRRATAKALALNGYKDGIAVLIETIRYPSIDTEKFYDHELVNDLAYFCGVDFAEEKRYAYDVWAQWWRENGPSVRLDLNLAIMEDIRKAFNARHEEEGIAIFEDLLAAHPDNVVIKSRYSRFCYEWITFRLLTREKITDEILERCLRLKEIMSRLDPNSAEKKASLAGYYARLSKLDQAIAAMQAAIALDPQNSDYQKVLRQFERLSKGPTGN